jgi:hypothetical protein
MTEGKMARSRDKKKDRCPGCCPDGPWAYFEKRHHHRDDDDRTYYTWKCNNCGHESKPFTRKQRTTPNRVAQGLIDNVVQATCEERECHVDDANWSIDERKYATYVNVTVKEKSLAAEWWGFAITHHGGMECYNLSGWGMPDDKSFRDWYTKQIRERAHRLFKHGHTCISCGTRFIPTYEQIKEVQDTYCENKMSWVEAANRVDFCDGC